VHGLEQRDAFVVAQRFDRMLRVQPRLPQHLVGDEVADARDPGLVEQPRLQRRDR